MEVFANAKDKENKRFYLVADMVEEIDSYCEERGLEIINRPEYVEPGMVSHHFDWVGKRNRPAIFKISTTYTK